MNKKQSLITTMNDRPMRAGDVRFKLTWSSLWHLWLGGTRLVIDKTITILRVVLLLDVSKWQGVIDFVKMKAAGMHGVIIKCGQILKDPQFDNSWLRAKQAGIPRGTYWFFDSRQHPLKQAADWWNWIKADKGELMHFADYEENYAGTYKGWKNFKIFLQEFQRLSSLPSSKIGIYTGYYYWIANSPTTLVELNWFAQFPLWLAWYTSNPANVLIPKPWTALILWQYGTPANGEKYGAESIEIDENNFNGDALAYKTRFALPDGSVILPPIVVVPPDPPVPLPDRPVIIPYAGLWIATVRPFNNMIVRTYPLVTHETRTPGPEYVRGGEIFEGKLWTGNNFVWMQIETSTRATLIGKWVAVRSIDGTSKFITLRALSRGATPVSLYHVRKWGDPVMVKEADLSVDIVGTSNFQAVGLYNKETGWGGVSNFLAIPRADITRLMALQVEDDYEDKQPVWRSQKMNWLCKTKGTIYFTGNDMPGWNTASQIKWGTIALGGNLVAVAGVEDMLIKTSGETEKRWRKMARLAGFRKTDWGKPLAELLATGLVHRCYCAYSGNDFGDSPKGIIYSPFWSPLDWDFAGNAKPQAFYLPVDWLVPA